MSLHRATVNLPGLAYGQVAEVPAKEAARWVDAGYLDPITKSEARTIPDSQITDTPATPITGASDA